MSTRAPDQIAGRRAMLTLRNTLPRVLPSVHWLSKHAAQDVLVQRYSNPVNIYLTHETSCPLTTSGDSDGSMSSDDHSSNDWKVTRRFGVWTNASTLYLRSWRDSYQSRFSLLHSRASRTQIHTNNAPGTLTGYRNRWSLGLRWSSCFWSVMKCVSHVSKISGAGDGAGKLTKVNSPWVNRR